jgi:hypothetical protein
MKKRWIVLLVLAAMLVLGVVGSAMASPSGDEEISWWTVDGGGETSTGGGYALSGTIGQPDAGEISGGDYTLSGGFWVRMAMRYIFLPLVLRNY